jgi:Bacterial Ig-like domain (group 3)/Galactose oxidase, central domain
MLTASRRIRCTVLSLVFLFSFALCFPSGVAYAAVGVKNLQVVDLPTAPSEDEISKARESFHAGNAIVRMAGVRMEDAFRMLQVPLPEVEATSANSNRLIPLSAPLGGEKLTLKAIAAYIDGAGIVRSVESYAADHEGETRWRKLLEKWTRRELSRAAGGQVGDPAPPEGAWTTLYTTTVQASATGGDEDDSISVYRLNTKDPTQDLYLVYTIPTVAPDWQNQCDGIEICDWHTYSRLIGTSLTPNAVVTDHGPTGTINTSSGTFTIGVSGDPSASFGATWTQPDVETTDHTSVGGPSASWDEEFGDAIIRCNPAFGRVPPTSSGTFLSRQGTIYTVPGGTPSVQASLSVDAEFCGYGISGNINDFFDYSKLSLRFSVTLGPPVLSAIPHTMVIPAGGTGAISVGAYIPNSPQGLEWTIASNQSWLVPDSTGPFNTGRVVTVGVNGGTPNGSAGTISIDTKQPLAAPSVEGGPIEVNVTVGTPPETNRAGVLLVGGVTSLLNLAGTVFYDVNAKQVLPVEQPRVPRYEHTATQLNTGEILIVGGATQVKQNSSIPPLTAVSELFEPASMSFKTSGRLTTARYFHSAVLLPDGKVLIVGGVDQNGAPVQNAELYDPASGSFSAAGSMSSRRIGSAATMISGPGEPAQVLVYGGSVFAGSGTTVSTEIWSEASKSFTAGPNMVFSQTDFPIPVESSAGDFELVGGGNSNGPSTATTQILEAPSTFRLGPALTYAREGNTLTALADGAGVLTTGGAGNATAELKQGNVWSILSGQASCPGAQGCMVQDRQQHTATLLPDGTVFLAGGMNGANAALASTEIYDPATKQFTAGPVIPPQAKQTATFVSTSEVSLLAGPSPAGFGQKVTLAATVTVASGTATGKVTFLDGASILGTVPVAAGSASLDISTLAVGSHNLTAQYGADPLNAPSTSAPAVEVIGQESTNTSLSSAPNPSDVGELVQFTATIHSPTAATGSVVFRDGNKVVGTIPLKGNTAVYSTSSLSSGRHVMTAAYSGDASHGGSTSSALNQQVIQQTTTTALTVSTATATYGQNISLRAAVTGAGSMAGAVLFRDGSTSLGSVNLTNKQATLRIATLNAGPHSITANYTGDPTHSGSTSSSVPVTITQATPTITIRSSQNPSAPGQPVTFVARVAGPGPVAPSGTVSFSDGANAFGTPQPISSGSANISTSSLSAGSHAISAAYSGNANYTSAASTPLNQVVQGAATRTVLRANPNPSAVGQSVSFSVTVRSQQGIPSGSTRLLDGNVQIGTVNLANGAGGFSTSSLSAGSHSVTAVYGGDTTHQGSTSPAVVQTVNKAMTTVQVTSSLNPSTTGQPVSFTGVVHAQAGTPTGTVRFLDGATPIGGPQPLTNATASVTISTLSAGAHSITARYGGDTNDSGSTSPTLTQRVNSGKLPVTFRLTSTPDPSTVGQNVRFTAVLTSTDGAAPGGSVTISEGSTIYGSGTLLGGRALIGTSAIPAGVHEIRGTYGGDATHQGATSDPVVQTVNQ